MKFGRLKMVELNTLYKIFAIALEKLEFFHNKNDKKNLNSLICDRC